MKKAHSVSLLEKLTGPSYPKKLLCGQYLPITCNNGVKNISHAIYCQVLFHWPCMMPGSVFQANIMYGQLGEFNN